MKSPCLIHGCDLCCRETVMPLTHEDIERITGKGYEGFYLNIDGKNRLKNKDGVCWFLIDGKCRIYEDRPEGCRLYPLIINRKGDKIGLDSDCPHHDEFKVIDSNVTQLLKLVKRVTSESRKEKSDNSL